MRKFALQAAAVAAVLALTLLWASCGDTFRPIITPVPQPGGDPQSQHRAIVLSTGGASVPGATSNLDVSGDTDLQDIYVGLDPVWAAVGGNVYVVNRGSKNLSSFPTFFSSATPTTVSLPANSNPVFASLSGANVYVADTANNAVDVVSGGNVTIGTIPVGSNPVAMAPTPDGTKLYVVNQGSDSVTVITPQNSQVATTITLSGGAAPVSAAASTDSKWVLVAEKGLGKVAIINTADQSFTEVDATSPANAGAGPSYITYDFHLRRFYVVNTAGNSLSIFDETQPTPALLATVSVGPAPNSVAVLSDGTRAYTANQGDGTVSVVNVVGFSTSKTIPVAASGQQVMWVAASSDATKVYAAVKGSNNTTDPGFTAIIHTDTDTVQVKVPPPRTDPNCNPATSPTPCTYTQPIFVAATA